MLLFGVDVPLVEIVFAFTIISLIILVEVIVIIILLLQNLRKAKELSGLLNNLSQALVEIKKEAKK